METPKPCSKAGRPRGFCADTALDRALDVFWRKGFDGTSLSDLTVAMGINRPSLYAAYGNKQSLFRMAIARYGEHRAALFQAAEKQPTARAFIEHILNEAATEFTNPAHPAGCFTVQGAGGCCGNENPVHRDLAANRSAAEKCLAGRLQRAVDDGELPAGTDAAALAGFFAAILQGMAVQAANGTGCAALRTVIGTAMRAWPGAGRGGKKKV